MFEFLVPGAIAIGGIKAVNAARLSLKVSESHKILLDQVTDSIRQIAVGMSSRYKETSLGGLAVNVVEC